MRRKRYSSACLPLTKSSPISASILGEIFGVHVLAPEIRIIEVFARGVAEQRLDIVADEDRREIVPSLEAVDHRRRGVEQPGQPLLHRGLEIDEPPLGSLLGLARRLVQDLSQ